MSESETLLHEAIKLQRNGRHDQAIRRFERFAQLQPDNASGWHYLAIAAQQAGKVARAREAINRAIKLRPGDVQLFILAGNIFKQQGDLKAALSHFERATRLDPSAAQAYNSIGSLHHAAGSIQAATTAYRAAVDANPRHKRAWNNLGSMLMILDRVREAVQCFEKALELDPDYAYALLNYGRYQLTAGFLASAEESLTRALELEPRLAEAYLNLGQVYRLRRDLDRAEQSLRQVLRLNPRQVNAWLFLAEILADKGMRGKALKCYEQVSELSPGSLRACVGRSLMLPKIYRSSTEVDEARVTYEQGIRFLNAEVDNYLDLHPEEKLDALQWNNFLLAYQGRDDRELQQGFSRFQRRLLESVLPRYCLPIEPRLRGGQRLKVGFVSGFFYSCTVGKYFRSWITELNQKRFETIVFSLNPRSDQLSEEIRRSCGTFHQQVISLRGLAQAIREADLDVLIYPELGMNSRAFALANLRLAPLQCAAWGHPVTTGHDNIDVFISVSAMEPPGAEAHYSERLVTLPGIGTSYTRPAVPKPVTRASLRLPEDAILYLFPQSLFKIHPDNDALLVEILAREPRAVLVMFQDRQSSITKQFVERLTRQFAMRGLSTDDRVKFLARARHDDYLRVNQACDVMLDSLYWSGGNTALDALACSLPIVTRPGEHMRGRQSLAMLTALGLEQLVAASNDDYVNIALALGRDSDWRTDIRAIIAERSAQLFEQQAPIRALESLLQSACA